MTIKKYSLFEKIRILIWSSRPVSWINTAFPYIACYLFINRDINLEFWLTAIYFLIPYNMLIYVINDIYDYESDIANPRKGGVEGAVLDKSLHNFMFISAIFINIPFILLMFANGTLGSNILLIFIVFNALAYSVKGLRFKEIPFLDSISSSLHFVLPLVYVFVLYSFNTSNIVYVLAFVFWGMASHAFGAVQDIIPDRKAKLKSIATFLGAKQTVRFSLLLYVLSSILLLFKGWPEIIISISGLLYILIVIPYVNLADKDSARSNAGWRWFMKVNQFVGFLLTIILILYLNK